MPTHYKGTERERRALDAYIKLTRASETVDAKLAAALGRHGLTTGQLGVLEALLHLGPMCQNELGRKLLRSGGNVTTVLDNLEKRGLVRRKRTPEDRRFVRVELTAEGRRFIAGVFPGHADNIARLLGTLSAAEQRELGRLCAKLGTSARAIDV